MLILSIGIFDVYPLKAYSQFYFHTTVVKNSLVDSISGNSFQRSNFTSYFSADLRKEPLSLPPKHILPIFTQRESFPSSIHKAFGNEFEYDQNTRALGYRMSAYDEQSFNKYDTL